MEIADNMSFPSMSVTEDVNVVISLFVIVLEAMFRRSKISATISVGGGEGAAWAAAPSVGKTLVSIGQFFQKDITGKATA